MCLQQFFTCLKQFLPSWRSETLQNTARVTPNSNEILGADAVQLFLEAVLRLPAGQRLDAFLLRAIEYEEEIRRIFVNDRGHPALVDPYVGLFDVFAQKPEVWKVVGRPLGEYHDEHFIMPLPPRLRKTPGSISIVPTIHEFERNWNIFTHNVLSNICWDNIIAAGGSVHACLEPYKGNPTQAQRNIRYQSTFAASDIDLFIWGLNASQAKAKMIEIYESISACVSWKVTCVRKSNVVSIHTLFPARPLQIILRLYLSPAEILAGFDVDSACYAYDGHRVWASPRALASCVRQCNTVDLTRRSPSYEVRLAKYAERGYEVYLPSLMRARINPSIFYRPSARGTNGLARLLVLERLYFRDPVLGGLEYPWKRVLAKGAACAGPGRKLNIDFQSSDYDIAWVIPYGPEWDAQKITMAVAAINQRMNEPWELIRAGRRLHRHPLFAGSMRDCLEDFCTGCPSPYGENEVRLVSSESTKYIRGPVRFLETNPGQQLLTGSFRPLDMDGWEDDAYKLDERAAEGRTQA